MKRNYFNNLAGNSFAANAGSKINKSGSARGIIKDEIPRYGAPGVADIIGQILGREYDPDIARNRVPGWMNMPENRQNTGMTANARQNTSSAQRAPETPSFGSIRELANHLRKQAGGTASRIGAMTPPYNPHAALPTGETGIGNPQNQNASGQQQDTPKFTSFRELGEHLKRQARGEIAAANAGAGIVASDSSPANSDSAINNGNANKFISKTIHDGIIPSTLQSPNIPRNKAQNNILITDNLHNRHKIRQRENSESNDGSFVSFYKTIDDLLHPSFDCPDTSLPKNNSSIQWEPGQERADTNSNIKKYNSALKFASDSISAIDSAAIEFDVPPELIYGIIVDEQFRMDKKEDKHDRRNAKLFSKTSVGPLQISITTARNIYNHKSIGKLLRDKYPGLQSNSDFMHTLYNREAAVYFATAILAEIRSRWDECVSGNNLDKISAFGYHSSASEPKMNPVLDPRSRQIVDEFSKEY